MLAYLTYKDTNIEWLGKVPSHWTILKNKYLASYTKGKNPDELLDKEELQGSYPYLAMEYLRGKKTEPKYAKLTNGLYLVKDEQPLIIWDGSNAGEFVKGKVGILSSTMAAATLKQRVVHQFYWYLTVIIENQMRSRTVGMGIPHVDGSELNNLFLCFPTQIDEQETIVNFLDRETARIDNLIAEKQTFINLLKEKRQALISHVVTKGLDPNIKMKDSGIEWIGEVPEHWELGKIKYVARISNGATPNRDTKEFWEGGTVGWLNSSKINDVYIENADQFITEFAVEKTSVQPVKPNDLVMAITGEGQTRGRVAICKTHAMINQHLAAISISSKHIDVEYLFFWLTSQYARIRYESSGAGSTKGAITCTDIGFYPVPMPPSKEQELIVCAVKEKLAIYDVLLRETEGSIQFLQEHRMALISAAVTGKIDVRTYEEAAA